MSGALMLAAALQAAVAGTGPVQVVMEERSELPGFTVYRPADLAKAAKRMPLLVWANGGCANLGNSASALLGEVASHGYWVVAIGPVGDLPERRPAAAPTGTPEEQLRARVVANGDSAPTKPEQLSQAIDWAETGPLNGRIDTGRVAAAGHSCGGLQAIAASAADPRIDTTVALNSGVFVQPRVKVDKGALAKLRGPIAYFIGGPGDIAYANAEDDFRRITAVPVFKANSDFGHGGKLREPHGGPTAPWLVRWLDWTLKGDTAAKAGFAGADCGMCMAPGWSVKRKGLD